MEGKSGWKRHLPVSSILRRLNIMFPGLKFLKESRESLTVWALPCSSVCCVLSAHCTPHTALFIPSDRPWDADSLISILRQGNIHREENDLVKVTQQTGVWGWDPIPSRQPRPPNWERKHQNKCHSLSRWVWSCPAEKSAIECTLWLQILTGYKLPSGAPSFKRASKEFRSSKL